MSLGLYLHVPFCKQKCPYCDFYSLCNLSLKESYVKALIKAIEFYGDKSCAVDSIYFGGGTPSLLPYSDIDKILKAVKNSFNLQNAEITLEANPSSVDGDYFEKLLEAGINRLSFGVQSLNDDELKILGRLHNSNIAEKAILSAKEAGFKNISADLMIGVSKQTNESLMYSIEKLSEYNVSHISSYLLKIKKGTPYFKVADKLDLPNDDEMANRYLLAVETLEKFGYKQYEISNFSKVGFESKHNLKYWKLENYLGLGPAAHSFYKGNRFYFKRDLNSFLEMAENESFAPELDEKPNLKEEYIMLSLRLKEGLSFEKAKEYGIDVDVLLKQSKVFIDAEYMTFDGENLFLTPKGFLVSNSIIARLI